MHLTVPVFTILRILPAVADAGNVSVMSEPLPAQNTTPDERLKVLEVEMVSVEVLVPHP